MSDDARTEEEPSLAPLEPPPAELTSPPPASQRERRIAVAVVALTTLAGGVGTALSPYLLVHHPVWLIALSPDMRHIVLGAASIDLETMLMVCVPRRIFGMYTAWALGAAYGGAALGFIEGRYPRVLRAVRFIERTFVKTGPMLLLVWPTYTLSLIAGVVTGGDVDANTLVTEEYLMTLERQAFCSLLTHPKTQERIMGMLQTGKPVRN